MYAEAAHSGQTKMTVGKIGKTKTKKPIHKQERKEQYKASTVQKSWQAQSIQLVELLKDRKTAEDRKQPKAGGRRKRWVGFFSSFLSNQNASSSFFFFFFFSVIRAWLLLKVFLFFSFFSFLFWSFLLSLFSLFSFLFSFFSQFFFFFGIFSFLFHLLFILFLIPHLIPFYLSLFISIFVLFPFHCSFFFFFFFSLFHFVKIKLRDFGGCRGKTSQSYSRSSSWHSFSSPLVVLQMEWNLAFNQAF